MTVLKRKPERIMLRVRKGALVPAFVSEANKLRRRGYHLDDILAADLRKPRNPKFSRLVHAFGKVCAENIEAFHGLDGHTVLKRLQLEGDIGCDEIALNFPGIGPCTYRVPQSLSFESMEEGQFRQVFQQFCEYVSRRYWPDLTPEQIAAMAEFAPEDTP